MSASSSLFTDEKRHYLFIPAPDPPCGILPLAAILGGGPRAGGRLVAHGIAAGRVLDLAAGGRAEPSLTGFVGEVAMATTPADPLVTVRLPWIPDISKNRLVRWRSGHFYTPSAARRWQDQAVW